MNNKVAIPDIRSDKMPMAMVKRKDLQSFLHLHLQNLATFDYAAIIAFSSAETSVLQIIVDINFPVDIVDLNLACITEPISKGDCILKQAIDLEKPFILNLSKINTEKKRNHFSLFQAHLQHGISEVLLLPIKPEMSENGVIILYLSRTIKLTDKKLMAIDEKRGLISLGVSNLFLSDEIEKHELEKQMLLSLSTEITKIRDKNGLLALINTKLKQLFYFNHSNIVSINEDGKTFTSFLRDPDSVLKSHKSYDSLQKLDFSVEDPVMEKILASEELQVIDVKKYFEEGTLPEYLLMSYESGIKEIAAITLPGDHSVFGVLSFFSDKKYNFDKSILAILRSVASQVAIAISNILANEDILKKKLEKEMLLTLSGDMARIKDKNDLLSVINTKLKKLFYFTHSSVSILSDDRQSFKIFLTDPGSQSKKHPGYTKLVSSTYKVHDGVFETFLGSEEPTVSDYEIVMRMKTPPEYAVVHYEVGLREAVSIPLFSEAKVWGVLHFYSDRKGTFSTNNVEIIKGVANQVAVAISNILAHEEIVKRLEEINNYRKHLEQEKFYLQQEINTAYNYSDLIGPSAAMQRVYHLISQVAYSNSTVLLLGETGTGKELIARAIHSASTQKDKLMVKVNCAALPSHLIESELFGHERGSFTGAFARRVGKFELADNGTLFLDEIGELPVELQAKILRALQEKEIERVGGKSVIKVNVRIIAATNRNLEEEVKKGKFRSDLYYRLNVFPIVVPPLRERKEDIPSLVEHFIARYARNTGKKTSGASKKVIRELMDYQWPGNVRELEHLIERSVLLSDGATIKQIPKLSQQDGGEKNAEDSRVKSLDEMERDYILGILKLCNGKVQGVGGAAELLKIPPTTLHSKIKKLGIKKKLTT